MLPVPKSDFIGLEGTAHLATGGEPPLLKAHRDAFERFAADKSQGFDGYSAHWDMVDQVREKFAKLLSAEAGDIALTANASEGIARVTGSMDWKAGESVVVAEKDYASGRYALGELSRYGVEIRLVPSRGWEISETDLVDACDDTTKLVYVAQVNALTGQHLDIHALSAGLEASGTALLVDSSHAFGAVPVDASQADFTVSANYKFTLGIHDGVFAWNRRRRPDFTPRGVGWWSAVPGQSPDRFERKPDAKRLEFGNVGHLSAYLLDVSLDYLDAVGINAIATHVRRQTGRLIDGYRALGLEVITPDDPQRRAANACFAHPDNVRIMQDLAQQNILVWADNGRVRASCHLFTSDNDIDRCLDALKNCV